MPDDGPSFDPMRAALMGFMEGMTAFTDAVVGYRAQLEAAGYSPTMAEQIAAEMHRQLIITAFTTLRKGSDA